MKLPYLHLLLPLLLILSAGPVRAEIPALINYQGYVTDQSGTPIGNNGPVERTVEFRFWDHATNAVVGASGNLLYAETQTVTINEGNFSVLIGNGAATAAIVNSTKNPTGNLAEAFGDAEVFLGIIVDDGTATADPEISPRQQIVTTAFAFRAKVAESVDIGAITNDMLSGGISGSKITNDSVTSANLAVNSVGASEIVVDGVGSSEIAANAVGADEIADDAVATAKLQSDAVTSSKIKDGTITEDDIAEDGVGSSEIAADAVGSSEIADGSVTYADLDPAVKGFQKGTHLFYNGGNVGIGLNTPTKAKLEVKGSAATLGGTQYAYFAYKDNAPKTGKATAGEGTSKYSIYADQRIMCEEMNVFSDERIKTIEGRSDSIEDLSTLMGIEITDYRHKDVIGKGSAPLKKVIAQQVEGVFPQAVSKHKDVVPDIYQPAPCKDGWVKLATTLKKGERVKLITESDGESVHEVLEVKPDGFRTNFEQGNQVFVYGREVDDFRSVDYDAIAMLNVSATQELQRRLAQQETELVAKTAIISTLEQRLAALEQRDKQHEARFAKLEKLPEADSGVQPVSAELSSAK